MLTAPLMDRHPCCCGALAAALVATAAVLAAPSMAAAAPRLPPRGGRALNEDQRQLVRGIGANVAHARADKAAARERLLAELRPRWRAVGRQLRLFARDRALRRSLRESGATITLASRSGYEERPADPSHHVENPEPWRESERQRWIEERVVLGASGLVLRRAESDGRGGRNETTRRIHTGGLPRPRSVRLDHEPWRWLTVEGLHDALDKGLAAGPASPRGAP